MGKKIFRFKENDCSVYFNDSFSRLEKIIDKKNAILLIDKKVCLKHAKKFKEWRIIINEEVFQKIKDKEMDQMIYLLDSNNIVIAKAIFVRPVKPLPNGKTSISLVIKEIMNKSEIKDTVFFIFKEDLSE